MIDLLIEFNDGFQYISRGWSSSIGFHQFGLMVHDIFPDVRSFTILKYQP